LKSISSDTMLVNRDFRITVLESKIDREEKDFNERLNIERAKFDNQKAITEDMNKHSSSLAYQLKYAKKVDRRHKWQRNILGGLLVGLIVVSVAN